MLAFDGPVTRDFSLCAQLDRTEAFSRRRVAAAPAIC
jgi:hypothetical protein